MGSSLPSAVTISIVEEEIWSVLILNLRRRIHMITLLQSVTIKFRRLLWHISYYKVWQINFITQSDRLLLQSPSGITKCDRLLLQGASGITKCDGLHYKVRQVLQCARVITKWDVQLSALRKPLILDRWKQIFGNFVLIFAHNMSWPSPFYDFVLSLLKIITKSTLYVLSQCKV